MNMKFIWIAVAVLVMLIVGFRNSGGEEKRTSSGNLAMTMPLVLLALLIYLLRTYM